MLGVAPTQDTLLWSFGMFKNGVCGDRNRCNCPSDCVSLNRELPLSLSLSSSSSLFLFAQWFSYIDVAAFVKQSVPGVQADSRRDEIVFSDSKMCARR